MPFRKFDDGTFKASGSLAVWLYDLQESFQTFDIELYDGDKIWDAFLIVMALSMGTKAQLKWEKGWFSRSKARKMESLLNRFKDNEISYLEVLDYMAENLSIEAMRLIKKETLPNITEILFSKTTESNGDTPKADSTPGLVKVARYLHYSRARTPIRWFGIYDNSVLAKLGMSSDIKLKDFPGVVVPGLNRPKRIYSSIFLSHSHADKEFAKQLARDLLIGKIAVWFDEAEIRGGDSLSSRILEGIAEMEFFGVILSPNAVESLWVRRELEAARDLESSVGRPKILPIRYQVCEQPAFIRDRIHIDFTNSVNYKTSFDALLNTLLDLPQPRYMTAKEAARLVKSVYDPRASLCGLSQQGICQQCISEPVSLRNDWHYADAKSGRSTIWILEYYDWSEQQINTYSVVDGRVAEYPSGTLEGGIKVIDFNFIDSDIAVSIALESARSAISLGMDSDSFFVEAMLKYCEPPDDFLWFVLFFDFTLAQMTYVVEINPRDGTVVRTYQPSEVTEF